MLSSAKQSSSQYYCDVTLTYTVISKVSINRPVLGSGILIRTMLNTKGLECAILSGTAMYIAVLSNGLLVSNSGDVTKTIIIKQISWTKSSLLLNIFLQNTQALQLI